MIQIPCGGSFAEVGVKNRQLPDAGVLEQEAPLQNRIAVVMADTRHRVERSHDEPRKSHGSMRGSETNLQDPEE
jgi:hypothetical protein